MKENKLQPATDAEISQAIEKTLDEMEEEFKAIFNAPPTEEELAYEKSSMRRPPLKREPL